LKMTISLFKKLPSLPFWGLYYFLLLTGSAELWLLRHFFLSLKKASGFFKSSLKRSITLRFKISLPRLKLPKVSRLYFSLGLLPSKLPFSMPFFLNLRKRLKDYLPLPPSNPLALGLGFLTTFFAISIYLLSSWFSSLPGPTQLTNRQVAMTTKIHDRSGRLLYQIFQEKNRTLTPLEEIPDSLKWATVAIEDKSFYRHSGISIRGIARSAFKILTERKIQGGSTITQQLCKWALFTPERTLSRKIKEIITALRVEAKYPKDKILQMYLNEVPYGGIAWGVSAATEMYFDKPVRDLTLAESAFLAGLPAAPSYYSPFGLHPEKKLYKVRQEMVLDVMAREGYISEEEANTAKKEELTFVPQKTDILAPHFVMYVKEELIKQFGEDQVLSGGLEIITTLDLEIQKMAQEIVAKEIAKVEKYKVGNGAALVSQPSTGEILAMVGSRDYFDQEHDGNVNVTLALRQPGSAIKPINYATFFKKGFTPATLLLDVPTQYLVKGQKPYDPVNYDGQFHGAVQARFALGNSYNVPATRVLAINSVRDMLNTAYQMGITTLTDESRYGLSLTLGGGEVKMTDMAVAFGTLANLGRRQNLVSILKVADYKGKVLYEQKHEDGPQVLKPEVAYLVSHILLDNNARSAAFGSNSLLNIPGHPVSVKTGTTDDLRDNWTIGYTPSYLTAVWVGNNDNSPMNRYLVSGVTGAAPIFNQVMHQVLKDEPAEWPERPPGIVGKEVCVFSGTAPTNDCPKRFEYFIAGTESSGESIEGPPQVVKKTKMLIDKQTGQPANEKSVDIEERGVALVSDPLTHNYCTSCNFYPVTVDVAKIPYAPNIFEVENKKD
jgi:penicillin-binding protein 1C